MILMTNDQSIVCTHLYAFKSVLRCWARGREEGGGREGGGGGLVAFNYFCTVIRACDLSMLARGMSR